MRAEQERSETRPFFLPGGLRAALAASKQRAVQRTILSPVRFCAVRRERPILSHGRALAGVSGGPDWTTNLSHVAVRLRPIGSVHGVSIWLEDHSWKSGGRVLLEWKKSAGAAGLKGSINLSLSSIRPSIGTENSIPEKMDYRKIAVLVPVMNEVQFLFPSEPRKPLKPRSLYVVCLVEKDVRIERRRTCSYPNHEEINRH